MNILHIKTTSNSGRDIIPLLEGPLDGGEKLSPHSAILIKQPSESQ